MVLAVSIRYQFIDGEGDTSFTKIHVPTGFSIAQYTEFAIAFGQLLANITDGGITSASFCVGLDLSSSTIKAVVTTGADIAQKALFGFGTILAGFRTKLKLPAFRTALITSGSDSVDQSHADIVAFSSAMEDGIVVTGGTISPTDLRGNDVDALNYAREFFRKK